MQHSPEPTQTENVDAEHSHDDDTQNSDKSSMLSHQDLLNHVSLPPRSPFVHR